MIERPKQRNCQQEPPYPGADTVIMSLRDPDWVMHLRSEECPCEYPHLWDRCGRARMSEKEKRMREFAAMLSVGGLEWPVENVHFNFKVDISHYGGILLAPEKFMILPIIT
jgi:hypothetical protein